MGDKDQADRKIYFVNKPEGDHTNRNPSSRLKGGANDTQRKVDSGGSRPDQSLYPL